MGMLLILSLSANFALGVVLLVRAGGAESRVDGAELAAAIDFALDVLTHLESRAFLRLLRTGQTKAIATRFPAWPDYRDRHMATSLDLAP